MPLFVVILVIVMLDGSNCQLSGDKTSNDLTSCIRFRLLIIWHAYGRDSQTSTAQKHFIISLIKNLRNDTEIYISTTDAKLSWHFRKSVNSTWVYILASYTPGPAYNTIDYRIINTELDRFLDEVENQRLAEQIFFVVNDISVIREPEKMLEELTKKMIYVIYSGTNPPSNFWAALATDRYHLEHLPTYANVSKVVESVKRESCKDSRFVCDTDSYWKGKRCRSCSYLCPSDTTSASEICLNECPYFQRRLPCAVTGGNQSNIVVGVIAFIVGIFIGIGIAFVTIRKITGSEKTIRKDNGEATPCREVFLLDTETSDVDETSV